MNITDKFVFKVIENLNWDWVISIHIIYLTQICHIEISAVVCRLYKKPVKLQKTVGYRLTFIQSSDLHVHVNTCHSA